MTAEEKDKVTQEIEGLRFEENGFVTFVDMRPKEVIEKAIQKEGEEEKKEDAPMIQLDYTRYFKEYVPFSGKQLKHKYTVEIKRAMFDEEAFEVYKKYQKSIHNEDDKSKL